MLRMHLNLSWQIPSFVVVAILFIIGISSNDFQNWEDYPQLPALGFFLIGFFLIVMLVHHRRNLFYADIYQKTIAKIEKIFGEEYIIHHFQVEPTRNRWKKITSSLCLSVFLFVMILVSFMICIYYIIVLIS